MRTMQPVTDEFLSSDAFALCDLCFVMWKNVIHTAAVDIDFIAEKRGRHRTAFDVPAGATGSPGRIPLHFAIFFIPRFPQCEISDVLLIVFVVLHPPSRLELC